MPIIKDPVIRRLWPLYATGFAQGLVLWYAIEKVFMSSIGFDAGSIVAVTILINIVTLLCEIPFGILADRWSRKGVLAIAMIALAATSLLYGLSNSVMEYALASVLFGINWAAHSGIEDAIIYDTLLETHGKNGNFERYYGRMRAFVSVALVTGSLAGGVIANSFGFRSTYYWTVPICVLAVVFSLLIKEPSLHKLAKSAKLSQHTKETLRHIFRNASAKWIVVNMVVTVVLIKFMMQIDQLWPIALGLPVLLYGPLNASLLFCYGLGGVVASAAKRSRLILYGICLAAIASTYLLTVRNIPAVVVAQDGMLLTLGALYILINGKLHDTLPSQHRSGASSAISSISTVCFMIVALIFGKLAQNTSVFQASFLLIPLAIVVAYYWAVQRSAKSTG